MTFWDSFSYIYIKPGAPLLYSKPHFLNADKQILEQVEGLKPNIHLHESELNLHPLTGAAIKASVKMQFAVELVPWEAMPSFSKAPRAIIPFVWVELVRISRINLLFNFY